MRYNGKKSKYNNPRRNRAVLGQGKPVEEEREVVEQMPIVSEKELGSTLVVEDKINVEKPAEEPIEIETPVKGVPAKVDPVTAPKADSGDDVVVTIEPPKPRRKPAVRKKTATKKAPVDKKPSAKK